MNALTHMEYLESDAPPDQLLREYARVLARERREHRAGRRHSLSPRVRALVIAAHSMPPRYTG